MYYVYYTPKKKSHFFDATLPFLQGRYFNTYCLSYLSLRTHVVVRKHVTQTLIFQDFFLIKYSICLHYKLRIMSLLCCCHATLSKFTIKTLYEKKLSTPSM